MWEGKKNNQARHLSGSKTCKPLGWQVRWNLRFLRHDNNHSLRSMCSQTASAQRDHAVIVAHKCARRFFFFSIKCAAIGVAHVWHASVAFSNMVFPTWTRSSDGETCRAGEAALHQIVPRQREQVSRSNGQIFDVRGAKVWRSSIHSSSGRGGSGMGVQRPTQRQEHHEDHLRGLLALACVLLDMSSMSFRRFRVDCSV